MMEIPFRREDVRASYYTIVDMLKSCRELKLGTHAGRRIIRDVCVLLAENMKSILATFCVSYPGPGEHSRVQNVLSLGRSIVTLPRHRIIRDEDVPFESGFADQCVDIRLG